MKSIRAFWRSNSLVRLFVVHSLIGFAISTLTMAAILIAPTGDLRRLLLGEPLAIAVLWLFMGLTFASAQMGMAIMEQAKAADGGGGGHGARVAKGEPAPALAPAAAPER